MSWIGRLVHAAVTQPLREPVPADDAAYLRRKGRVKLAVRTARRMLQFGISGQASQLRTAIGPGIQRLLWIHDEAPQIGDALMDLAPRSLLHERGIAVDLLAAPHIAALFDGDRWLRRTHADGSSLSPSDFDLVITSSHTRRALARKQALAAALPWVSLAGYYTVPDYQRASFATRRLAALLGLQLDAAQERWHARQKLETASPAASIPARADVVLAVGGVRAERSYAHWPEVAALLANAGVARVGLVGSANGRAISDRIIRNVPASVVIDDHVARLDLHATQAVLRNARLVIAADGGLMHLALTTPTPLLALFNRAVDPAWRLPIDIDGAALRADGVEVSAIDPATVAEQSLALLQRQSG